MIDTGFCRNERCPNAASGEPIERYPGPGEFCPACGERLQPRLPTDAVDPDALLNAQSRMAQAFAPQPDAQGRRWHVGAKTIAVGAALVVLVLAVTAFVHLSARTNADPVAAARVCTSSIGARVARDVVHAYALKNRSPEPAIETRPVGNVACDVRFWAEQAGPNDALLGYDGIVVVVHPQNPLTRLTTDQVRDVFAGRIGDWSQLGRRSGRVVALATDEGSDEMQRAAATLFRGTALGSGVARMPTSADIVRRVASAGGGDTIGIVTFSEAVPAKVLALGTSAPPSTLSIGSGRYPLSVNVLVASDLRTPPEQANALIAFARSKDGQAIVARSGLVPKEGF